MIVGLPTNLTYLSTSFRQGRQGQVPSAIRMLTSDFRAPRSQLFWTDGRAGRRSTAHALTVRTCVVLRQPALNQFVDAALQLASRVPQGWRVAGVDVT